ncbi:hypothetical protein ZIOFF_019761 [Zingiber officinale]|uniref:Uncharacterized protein n=1 Tax=Zingiber officinale TaxID=94328 RepID=A0A8J5LJG0_ZINOF|nr:hypothetical protein ZIOFF_019761 [Zingiber officinale]
MFAKKRYVEKALMKKTPVLVVRDNEVFCQNNKEDCVDTSIPELQALFTASHKSLDASTLRLEETKRARELLSSRAAITCYVALHPNLRGITGKYFDEELSRRLGFKREDG